MLVNLVVCVITQGYVHEIWIIRNTAHVNNILLRTIY